MKPRPPRLYQLYIDGKAVPRKSYHLRSTAVLSAFAELTKQTRFQVVIEVVAIRSGKVVHSIVRTSPTALRIWRL